MKTSTTFLVLVLLVCLGVWVYREHPTAVHDIAANFSSDSDTSEQEAPLPPPKHAEIITPETTTHLNTNHVRPVEQPLQPGTNGPPLPNYQ